jgi:hypothetical protein
MPFERDAKAGLRRVPIAAKRIVEIEKDGSNARQIGHTV